MKAGDKRKEIHYLDYEESRAIYMGWIDSYKEAVAEKDEMLTKVLGGSIRYDKEAVQTSVSGSPLDDYVAAVESKGLDKRIDHARGMLDKWRDVLEVQEAELRRSHEIYDKVYVCRYIEGMTVRQIGRKLNYSKSQVFRIDQEIQDKISEKK